ncbi:molybdopterin molybdotransferase MoeA [Rhodobacteraceae bacterium SC52]|nr:molybdopterin molybdotransferase MoeA [Rhodobacteraceae bacterium SC52]
MISVAQALDQIFALLTPLGSETVALRHASGRVLAADATARRDQPPFDASQMDGYALRDGDLQAGAPLKIIGEAAAGHAFGGLVGPGEAVRIFTGAPVPKGADRVVMQEDTALSGGMLTVSGNADRSRHIRQRGGDFAIGDHVPKGRVLRPADLMLLASMNIPEVPVVRRPVVAILSTGDELVMPGECPAPDQIIASNAVGLATLAESVGAIARILPLARDTVKSLEACLALAEGADLVVTSGGASVGDHDLLAQAAKQLGLDQAFYKVAMRPGKPLMAGRMRGTPMIGLPGNPVSTMVCGTIFMQPALRLLGGHAAAPAPRSLASLAAPLSENGAREHYMRAMLLPEGRVRAADRQDSSLQKVLSEADALIVRPVGDLPRGIGETVEIVKI